MIFPLPPQRQYTASLNQGVPPIVVRTLGVFCTTNGDRTRHCDAFVDPCLSTLWLLGPGVQQEGAAADARDAETAEEAHRPSDKDREAGIATSDPRDRRLGLTPGYRDHPLGLAHYLMEDGGIARQGDPRGALRGARGEQRRRRAFPGDRSKQRGRSLADPEEAPLTVDQDDASLPARLRVGLGVGGRTAAAAPEDVSTHEHAQAQVPAHGFSENSGLPFVEFATLLEQVEVQLEHVAPIVPNL